jgi:hypothetical protein
MAPTVQNPFNEAAALQAPFTHTLGRMLVANGVITQGDYDLAGEAQARTAVIASLYDERHDLKPVILGAFPNRDKKSIDMNGAAFRYSKETIVPELDKFLRGLTDVNDLDVRLQSAKAAVDAERGVHANAAAAAVLHKALFLKKDEQKPVVDASLMMQMATRGLTRVQAIELGQPDREAAMTLINLHNKLNYKFDSDEVAELNEALLAICTVEQGIHRQFAKAAKAGTNVSFEIHNAHETLLRAHTNTLLEGIPHAIGLYNSVGQNALADKSRQVYDANRTALDSYFISRKPADLVSRPN